MSPFMLNCRVYPHGFVMNNMFYGGDLVHVSDLRIPRFFYKLDLIILLYLRASFLLFTARISWTVCNKLISNISIKLNTLGSKGDLSCTEPWMS